MKKTIEINNTALNEAPITDSMMGIYLEWTKDKESLAYNISYIVSLPDDIDIDRFIKAVEETVKSHRSFHLCIVEREKGIFMRSVNRPMPVKRVEEEIKKAKSEFVKPFDLNAGPLARFEIVEDENKKYFFFDIHHLVFDGTSLDIFLKEIAARYEERAVVAEEKTIFDYGRYESKKPVNEEGEKFFDKIFEGVDCDSVIIPDRVTEEENIAQKYTTEVKTDISSYSKKRGIRKSAVLLGAFAYTLAKFNGTNEACFATVNHGRHMDEYKKSTGMFVRTSPLYFQIDENKSVEGFLKETQEYFDRTRDHDDVSFGELARKYGLNVDVSFVYQSTMTKDYQIDGQIMSADEIDKSTTQSKIDLMVFDTENGFWLECHYQGGLYSRALIASFVEMYGCVLKEFLLKERLYQVQFTNEESLKHLEKINENDDPDIDLDKTILDIFKEMVSQYPDNKALYYKGKEFTYKEVNQRSNAIAQVLKDRGIGKNSVVGILINKSELMGILPLAVLKTGACYLPIDPSYPVERINLMLSDSEAQALLADDDLIDLPTEFGGLRIKVSAFEGMRQEEFNTDVFPEDRFIILYTSGTTGKPKGVQLSQRNLNTVIQYTKKLLKIGKDSRTTAYASFGFDASMLDLYPSITSGGTLYIIPNEMRLNLDEIEEFFNENRITHAFMTTQIGRQFATQYKPEYLRFLYVGGEKLVPLTPPANFKLYNLYGPTECAIYITSQMVDKKYKDVPIGASNANTALYVTEPLGRVLPFYASGELWVSGPQVSMGYLNRPEKTAEAFTKNTYTDRKGYETIYHTGDVVRMSDEGVIQFIGRRDHQVKIRGFRIELTEVEEIIREYPGIRDATVQAFDEPAGGKFIAAYIVSDEKIDIDKMNEFILSKKPPYMVPAVTMQIDSIPVNQNQKVNKRALPKPVKKAEDMTEPQNEVQQKIFDILAEITGHREFGIKTDFETAGLNSIGAVRFSIQLAKEFERPVSNSDLKSYNTVEKMSGFLAEKSENEQFEVLKCYPLTKTQEGIFIECISHPGSTLYNIPILLKISKKLDMDKLKEALSSAVNAHPYLMALLKVNSVGDVQWIREDNPKFSTDEIVVCSYESKEQMLKDVVKPYELMDSRLFRIQIIEADERYLYLDFHHILCDGTSVLIFLNDISAVYRNEELPKEVFSGFEASLLEQRKRNSSEYSRAKAYYDSIFADCDANCLPTGDLKGTEPAIDSTNVYGEQLNGEKLKEFCAQNGVTANGLFTAAFGITLAKYVNKEQAVFTTIYNGRNDSRFERSMSMYVKTYPVMCNVGKEQRNISNREYVKNIGKQLSDSMLNDIYSFAEISRAYRINADVMFAYQGEDFVFSELCGEPCEQIDLKLDEVKAPLNVNVFIEGGRIRFFCEYRKDRFSRAYIEGFLGAFETAVCNLISKKTLGEVSVLSEKEAEILAALNDTKGTSYDSFLSLSKRFDMAAAEHRNERAVVCGGESLTFGELMERANSIGNALVEKGIKAEDIVALMLYRTIDVYPVRQGILKSGGAFLSIEPSYPDDRITYILENSGAKVLITTEQIYSERKALLDNTGLPILFVSELLKKDGSCSPEVEVKPEQLAYCIYTSGSTGKPKGVMIEQRNLLNFIDRHEKNNIAHYYGVGSTMLALAAITFDVSILEEFMMLYHGKCVAMATEEEIHNPILLAEMMIKNNVDMMKCTPSYMQTIIDIPIVQKMFENLKAICIGAEPFTEGLYRKMREAGIKGRIYNSYGPTETTISVTIDDMVDEKISIGRPVGNTKIFILDAFDNVLPRNVPGEIVIAGDSVGRGYMGLESMTAEKFIFIDQMRAYRSGDIGLWNTDGKIECKGRKDNQVKLRGLRIELDEIEKVMNLHQMISRSVVLVKENEGGQFLCGYYTGKQEVSPEELTAFMKTKLTEYMVPGVFVYLEKLPITGNGKVDKKALPEPLKNIKKRTGRKADNKLEEELCEIFEKALGTSPVFADDDFFELGGTSLIASKVVMQCMMKNINVVYANVFEYSTPAKLAAFIKGTKKKMPEVKGDNKAEDKVQKETRKALSYNRVEYVKEIRTEKLNRTLLVGATGFLGIHVFHELIKEGCEKVYVMVRGRKGESADQRLKSRLMYYFDDTFDSVFESGRAEVIDADITDADLDKRIMGCDFDTIINCAAIVKHFAVGDLIEKVNVEGVKRLITINKQRNTKLIQISTVSVAGESVDNSVPENKLLSEDELFFGQNTDNRYVNTKFRAEEAMLDAIEEGMRGKIIRVGNLMSREEDGEFQINFLTNGFMNRLRAYGAIGQFPVDNLDVFVEFSPIDYVAKAVVLLAGTNDEFTVFHAYNCHHVHMANIIRIMNEQGIKIHVVDEDKFQAHFNELLKDEEMNAKISSLLSYNSADGVQHRYIGADQRFSVKALYRLGFSWPLTSESYIRNAIEALRTLGFFDV